MHGPLKMSREDGQTGVLHLTLRYSGEFLLLASTCAGPQSHEAPCTGSLSCSPGSGTAGSTSGEMHLQSSLARAPGRQLPLVSQSAQLGAPGCSAAHLSHPHLLPGPHHACTRVRAHAHTHGLEPRQVVCWPGPPWPRVGKLSKLIGENNNSTEEATRDLGWARL